MWLKSLQIDTIPGKLYAYINFLTYRAPVGVFCLLDPPP